MRPRKEKRSEARFYQNGIRRFSNDNKKNGIRRFSNDNKKWENAVDNQASTSFDVAVQEYLGGQWIVEAIATKDAENPVRQVRFSGDHARERAHTYAARKYGLTLA